MLGNSWIAAQLAASQEGLSSVELVSYIINTRIAVQSKYTYILFLFYSRITQKFASIFRVEEIEMGKVMRNIGITNICRCARHRINLKFVTDFR
jgi:hypothetical protein